MDRDNIVNVSTVLLDGIPSAKLEFLCPNSQEKCQLMPIGSSQLTIKIGPRISVAK